MARIQFNSIQPHPHGACLLVALPAYQGIFCSNFPQIVLTPLCKICLQHQTWGVALLAGQRCWISKEIYPIQGVHEGLVLEMQIDTRLQTFSGPSDMAADALRVCLWLWLWVCRSVILLSPISSHPCLISQDAVRTMASGIGGGRDRGRRRCARRLPTRFCQPSLARSCPQATQTPAQVSASML